MARIVIGHEEVVIKDRDETLSIINDVLVAACFTAGSILFYFESLHKAATTMFLLGSVGFFLRPTIGLARRVQLRRLGQDPPEKQGR